MRFHVQMLPLALFALSVLHLRLASADDQSSDNQRPDEDLPLSQYELREITDQVLAKEPLLSSSPGIKFAEAVRLDGSEDVAFVIYHPHSEIAGIKQAFQVQCSRQVPDQAWNCEDAKIRRYLSLSTQEFEVRITGPIGSDAALAVIEATRDALPVSAEDGVDVPNSAMILNSYDDSATVAWVNFEGRSQVTMKAQLAEGGDPTQPDDWIVSRYEIE